MKTCTKCHVDKELEAFTNNSRKPDGKQLWCRDCHREYEREWRRQRGVEASPNAVKTCLKCGLETTNFTKDRSNSDGLQDWCRPCHKAYRDENREKIKSQVKVTSDRWYQENRLWVMYKALKRRSEKYPNDRCISFEEYIKLRLTERCPVCNVIMTEPEERKVSPTSKTIDRLDSAIGYTAENCTCMCYRCNSIKNAGSAGDHARLSAWIEERSKKLP